MVELFYEEERNSTEDDGEGDDLKTIGCPGRACLEGLSPCLVVMAMITWRLSSPLGAYQTQSPEARSLAPVLSSANAFSLIGVCLMPCTLQAMPEVFTASITSLPHWLTFTE